MRQLKARIEQGFDSAIEKTPEFLAFAKEFKKKVTKILKNAGCSDITFSVGHFDIHFCFTQDNGQTWAGFITDVRCCAAMVIRRTKSYNDHTGDTNNNIEDIEDFEYILKRTLSHYKDKPLYR